MSIFKSGFLVLSGLLLLSQGFAADDAQEFRRRNDKMIHETSPVSARSQALGGSYAALSNGAAGIYENPACLGAATDHEGITDLGFDYLDDSGKHVNVVNFGVGGMVNLNKSSGFDPAVYGNHSVGIVYQYQNYDYDSGGDGGINRVIGAYGRSYMNGRLFAGGSLGYHAGNWDAGGDIDDAELDHYWRRVEMKAGGIYRMNQRMAVGSTLMTGFGKFENQAGYPLEEGRARSFEFRIGFANQLNRKLLMAGDFSQKYYGLIDDDHSGYQEHYISRFSNGYEYKLINDRLTVRGGWYWEADTFHADASELDDGQTYDDNETMSSRHDNSGGITLGFSYYYGNFELSYALDIGTTGDVANTFNFELDF